jgi:PTS system mannose-specific IID component
MGLGFRDLLACFARTYLMGVTFNTRGLQNIGLAYAMDPGLRALYKDPEALRAARQRYLALYNTHPWWNPMLVGYFLFLESHIRHGALSPQALERIRSTTTYTLSAIGDSFFGGSLMIFWSLTETALLLQGMLWGAVAWLAVALILLQGFKLGTFWLGWRKGLTVLQRLRKLNLIAWAERVKFLNALLVALVWAMLFPAGTYGAWSLAAAALPGAAAYLVAAYRVPREALVFALAVGICVWRVLQ